MRQVIDMVFGAQSFRGHENVAFFHDQQSGLKAIIASRPVDQQKKLLHDNAVKFYGLPS